MKNRVRIVGVIMLLVFCFPIARSQENKMVVLFKNGSINSLRIRDVKNINFNSSLLQIVVHEGTNAVYSSPDVQRFYFETTTEIVPVLENTNQLIYPNPTKGLIYFKNISEKSMLVQIFNLNGVQVFSGRIGSFVQSVDISFLTRGVYLIKLNNQLAKLIKL